MESPQSKLLLTNYVASHGAQGATRAAFELFEIKKFKHLSSGTMIVELRGNGHQPFRTFRSETA
jgi:hypothetical protein